MERKNFIKTCGYACLGMVGVPALLSSCVTSKIQSGQITDSDLIVPLTDFETGTSAKKEFKRYLIIHNDQLKYPICVYRFSADTYTALWMECSHLGAELQVFGDQLQCPAHGSEFSNKGTVKNGPADTSLRSFPIIIEQDQLKISLKAV